MITVNDLALQYGKRVLFDEVNIKLTRGNCYGIIGANGAGKSTFMKILSGELDSTRGSVSIEPGNRMAVLKQNHFEFDDCEVMQTVLMGYGELYAIMQEKDAIYNNPNATDEDMMRAGELEGTFAEMNGWSAESDAAELLSNLGVREQHHYRKMNELTGPEKIKVLLAQALLGNPDILMMDEPTNDIDAETNDWLCNFLADYENLVIVVSHDRHFLDMVCTHIVDIDYQKVKLFTGNYTFWYEVSQLLIKQMADKNKKTETRRAELSEFIARFSANASKSKQATSRKKALEKLNIEELVPSARKYPFINFKPDRDPGDVILRIEGLAKRDTDGETLFNDISFSFNKGDKIAIVSRNSLALTSFFDILANEQTADEGKIEWGQTITAGYLPNENAKYFTGSQDVDLINWLRDYSREKDEQFVRGFLGRMLFSGEEVYKKASVLSGGEKVRCMLSKIMVQYPNFLILDEPTNHLDLESITAFNNALTDFTGNLIFTSHDIHFMDTVANRVIEIGPNGMIDKLMNFEEYLHNKDVKALRDELYAVTA